MTTAFHATQISTRGRGRGRSYMSHVGTRPSPSMFGRGVSNPRGSHSFSGSPRGFPGGSSILGPHPSSTNASPQGRPTCQICNRMGHSALDCYNRLNLSFEGRVPTKKLSAMAASTSSPSSSTWLLDSGANAHITSNLSNLQTSKEYQGSDHINGIGTTTGLSISHIGSSTLNTDSHSFALNNILYCPSASTNLLSIYKFTNDNNCYLLIYPTHFLVKDLTSGRTLFRGRSNNGLYPLRFHQ
ncbi:putative transcription factor interactor and regulator CCHC(Zn) family [Rosa chinensis]|uniref:Putative transcription factor interactor and regulator CCHC(Zn) family n=1 Tax=Rosa chinensis TaxID=74649 RepID=A0A2P6PZR2_ROSCH|nr:putative transcription factor interactor and regulator CCHC(Zn) family [Rosa chinensis]